MRILLEDGFSIEKGTGIGRYTQNLANQLGRQGAVMVHPFVEDRPTVPYFRQIIQIARVPVDGKDIEIWNFSHFNLRCKFPEY